jgi:DNA-3-methyladenine glycosylase
VKQEVLSEGFFARHTDRVARELLGTLLISTIGGERVSGRIVETEAYVGPHDPASHGAERIGMTPRNASMFAAPGLAYVYRIYGVHWCLNAVTEDFDYPAAVLIRALEPLEGIEVMRRRRGAHLRDRDLCSGPGKLAQALAIDATLDAHPLDEPPLWIEAGPGIAKKDITCGPRIGITQAVDWPLRFCVKGSNWLSRRS